MCSVIISPFMHYSHPPSDLGIGLFGSAFGGVGLGSALFTPLLLLLLGLFERLLLFLLIFLILLLLFELLRNQLFLLAAHDRDLLKQRLRLRVLHFLLDDDLADVGVHRGVVALQN